MRRERERERERERKTLQCCIGKYVLMVIVYCCGWLSSKTIGWCQYNNYIIIQHQIQLITAQMV